MNSLKIIKRKNKRAALEMSIGTIVILVLAMSMLILGLILVRTIFSGATNNVETMNKKVEAEINKLFVEDQRAVLYLPNRLAEVSQGDSFGLGFAIDNKIATQKFRWEVVVSDDDIRKKCGIAEREAESWITTGATGDTSIELPSGQKYYDVIRFNVPDGAVSDISTCLVRYKLLIKKDDGVSYAILPFDIDIE
jgi:hypothetical protein